MTATDASVPIACSLAVHAAKDRESEWRALLSRALLRSAPAPGGMRMELRELPGVRQELGRLITAEQDCCPFMTMSVDTTDQAVLVLTVTTSELGAPILRRLFLVAPDEEGTLTVGDPVPLTPSTTREFDSCCCGDETRDCRCYAPA